MSDFHGQQPGPQNPYQQQPAPQFQPAPPKPPKKPRSKEARIGWMILGGLGIFVAGLVLGAGADPQPSAVTSGEPAPTVTVTVPNTGPSPDPVVTPTNKPSPPPPAPPKATAPAVKDFKLTVKTLTKQCFGSAGCNVTFRILVTYSGPALDPSKSYEVLYTVKGGEDPVENKLTVTDGESSVDEEEMVSTSKSSAKLTAVVTDVSEV